MYKISRHLPATSRRLVLISQRGEGPCSMVVFPTRHASSHDPCEPKKKSNKLMWAVAGATVLGGATLLYAKQNRDFREWMIDNAPWADNIVAVVFQENMPIDVWAMNKVTDAGQSVKGFLFGTEGTIVEKRPTAADPPASLQQGPPDYNLPTKSLAPCYVEEVVVEKPEVPPTTVIMADAANRPVSQSINVSRDLVELEQQVHDHTKDAIDNYNKATEAFIKYNRSVNKIVEASIDEMDSKKFDTLRAAQKERNDAASKAAKANRQAEEAMEELTKQLRSGENAPPEAVLRTKRHLAKFRADLKTARDEFKEQEENACIADRYWSRVEQSRKAYMNELSALLPGVDVQSKKLSMEGGDADLLLLHTLKQVLHLQKELAEAQTTREQRLKRALESRDDKDMIEAKAQELVYKEKYRIEKEYYNKTHEVRAEVEKKRREDMKRQLEIHEEHLKDKLAAKEREVQKKFDEMVDETVEEHKVKFNTQLAELRGKLKAIEDSVKARSRADEAQRRAQCLWAAGESLLAATRKSSGKTKIDNEIKAVEKAAGNDELVKSVVKGISPEVREHGLYTENALREKYMKMEKTAQRVALVSKDGAPLPIYFLSYIQSLLLFSRVSDIPKHELENQPTDFSNMDSFDILQRARYFVERNDIAAALKYVNLLQGASKTAASGWREAAIKHLEIKQAAEAVMAHASASALGS